MSDESQAPKPRRQRAATPAKRKPARKPRAQRAAVPSAVTRSSGARQTPPIPPDVLEHFGGQERVELIVQECVPPDATAGDVLRLLLEARRLHADPLRREVYLARGMSRDGAGIEYAVAAKRDTLLAYAERLEDFAGWQAEAIYKGDTFARVDPKADGTLRERGGISHTSEGLREPEDGERPLGAWCIVERRGRPPVTFVARSAEYLPADEWASLDADDPRKRYPDRYIVKVAMCWPLRTVCGLTDVVGAEELSARPQIPTPQATQPAVPAIFEEGPMDALDARILDAYRQAAALDPMMCPPAKLSAHLASARATAVEVAANLDEPLDGFDQSTYDTLRDKIALELERLVAAEVARRRDPVALRRRLEELRAFDPSTLDEDARREYDTERAAVEEAATTAGVAGEPATA
jgi:hypothetical protein